MSFVTRKLFNRTSGFKVGDVYSTDTWTGNGTSQTITNGIDLSGDGGMVWYRQQGDDDLLIQDTVTGTGTVLEVRSSGIISSSNYITAFNSDGFNIGSDAEINDNTVDFFSNTFKATKGFFDVVEYTGDGTNNQAIAHSLEETPGFVLVKNTSNSTRGGVFFSGFTSSEYYDFARSNAVSTISNIWGTSSFDSSNFYVGANIAGDVDTNVNTDTYIAYLFTELSNVHSVGSYTGNGSTTGPTVTLGWEPQLVIIKSQSTNGNWHVYDATLDGTNPRETVWYTDRDNYDTNGPDLDFLSTGFQPVTSLAGINGSSEVYNYLAIKAE